MSLYNQLIEMCLFEALNRGDDGLGTICNCDIPSHVMMVCYSKIPPIESLATENRQQMWDFVNERFPAKTKEEKIKCCKIIYTVSVLL